MTLPEQPVVGIVGSAGAYGRWLCRFFQQQMGLAVIGHDPADPDSASPQAVLGAADVLVFSAPIRHTPDIIAQWVALSAGRESGQLWLDVTSVKMAPVSALLQSCAEVVGLHPMCAPPKSPSLQGRVLVVCPARLSRWRGWMDRLCAALQAQCVVSEPQRHDRIMALVQAMVHAGGLAQAGVMRQYVDRLDGMAGLMAFRTVGFELDVAVIARILALNPAIYEDIQFGNPYVAEMLGHFSAQLQRLHALVLAGDQAARTAFRQEFLQASATAFGAERVAEGNYSFERLGYLLADLAGERAVSVYLPQDRPGSLRSLLALFEEAGINLSSIHSSRTPEGALHFRLGLEGALDASVLVSVLAQVDASGIGQVLPS